MWASRPCSYHFSDDACMTSSDSGELRKISTTSRLPSALSSVMLSSRRSWASGGRNASRPSATHTVGRWASKPACCKRRGPVVAQIDRHRAQVDGRLGARRGQRRGLEIGDLRLVDLEHHRLGGPGQSVAARIEAGGQDHRLADAGCRRVGDELVDQTRADGQQVGHRLHAPRVAGNVDLVAAELAVRPAGEEVDADRPHQRLGERIVDEPRLGGAASARGHHGGGGSHARCQIPGVVLGARHASQGSDPILGVSLWRWARSRSAAIIDIT